MKLPEIQTQRAWETLDDEKDKVLDEAAARAVTECLKAPAFARSALHSFYLRWQATGASDTETREEVYAFLREALSAAGLDVEDSLADFELGLVDAVVLMESDLTTTTPPMRENFRRYILAELGEKKEAMIPGFATLKARKSQGREVIQIAGTPDATHFLSGTTLEPKHQDQIAWESEQRVVFEKTPNAKDIEAVAQAILHLLKTERAVRIDRVGIFVRLDRPATVGRNPSTGESIKIPATARLAIKSLPARRD